MCTCCGFSDGEFVTYVERLGRAHDRALFGPGGELAATYGGNSERVLVTMRGIPERLLCETCRDCW